MIDIRLVETPLGWRWQRRCGRGRLLAVGRPFRKRLAAEDDMEEERLHQEARLKRWAAETKGAPKGRYAGRRKRR